MRVTPTCDTLNTVTISAAANVQWAADAAYGGGVHMVIWSDGRSASSYRIYAARVTPAGAVLDPSGILIGPATNTYQYYPSIVYNGTRFFAVWGYYSSPYAVTGRFINTNGTPFGDTLRLASASSYIYGTKVAYDGSNYLVTYVEYGLISSPTVLKGIMVSGSGVPMGSPFVIADSVYYYLSSGLRFDGSKYIVTYCRPSGGYYQIFARYYNTSGTPIGTPFCITNNSYNCYYGDIVPGGGRFFNVWSEYRTTYDIYGNVDFAIGIDEENAGETPMTKPRSVMVNRTIELVNFCGQEMKVYDVGGRLLGTSVSGYYDCQNLQNGIYFVTLSTGGRFKVIKIE